MKHITDLHGIDHSHFPTFQFSCSSDSQAFPTKNHSDSGLLRALPSSTNHQLEGAKSLDIGIGILLDLDLSGPLDFVGVIATIKPAHVVLNSESYSKYAAIRKTGI